MCVGSVNLRLQSKATKNARLLKENMIVLLLKYAKKKQLFASRLHRTLAKERRQINPKQMVFMCSPRRTFKNPCLGSPACFHKNGGSVNNTTLKKQCNAPH